MALYGKDITLLSVSTNSTPIKTSVTNVSKTYANTQTLVQATKIQTPSIQLNSFPKVPPPQLLNTQVAPAPTNPPITQLPPKENYAYSVQGISKFNDVVFDNKSKTFINNEPKIMFVAEAHFRSNIRSGVILVWEAYKDATHYEVYKRNTFVENSQFERILFIDTKFLIEETQHYAKYLRQFCGIHIRPTEHFAIFDPLIKDDRVYEYKVRAVYVPHGVKEVDFGTTLQGFSTTYPASPGSTIFDHASFFYGDGRKAWISCLINDKIPYFGPPLILGPSAGGAGTTLGPATVDSIVALNETQKIMDVINECYLLFGRRDTFIHMIEVLGGLNSDFQLWARNSVNFTTGLFEYDTFMRQVATNVPVFKAIINLFDVSPNEQARLKAYNILNTANLILPTLRGIQEQRDSILSPDSLYRVFNFINSVFMILVFTQSGTAAAKELTTILESIR
jgi:hypothetical protein